MEASSASTLVLDCGTLTGHQQRELELPKASVPFFGINPDGNAHATYLPVKLSNGRETFLRLIFRAYNMMWRIEMTTEVPEISDGIIPDTNPDGSPNRRSNQAVVMTKVGNEDDAAYELRFVVCDSTQYLSEIAQADTNGELKQTTGGGQSRKYGWY